MKLKVGNPKDPTENPKASTVSFMKHFALVCKSKLSFPASLVVIAALLTSKASSYEHSLACSLHRILAFYAARN